MPKAGSEIRVSARSETVLRVLILIVGMTFILAFLFLAIRRLFASFELEWYEGIVLDHSLRLLRGALLYPKPSPRFVACLYPPFYYYCTAIAMKVFGVSYMSGRTISVFSTIGTAALVFVLVKARTGSRYYGWSGVALFLAAYQVTGFTFDIARIDPLLLLLLIVTTWLVQKSRSNVYAVLAAFSMALAFFTKQQAVFYYVPVVVWLLTNRRSSALIFIGVSVVLLTLGTVYLQIQNHGWYLYYVLDIPRAKSATFGWLKVPTVIPIYLCAHWPYVLIAACWKLLTDKIGKKYWKSMEGLIMLMFLMSVLQTGMHMGDQMSYKNIVLPLAAFSAILFPILLAEFSDKKLAPFRLGSEIALLLQLVTLVYNPLREPLVVLHGTEQASFESFLGELRAIPGEILIPAHGFFPEFAGKATHANVQTIQDVLLLKDSVAVQLKFSIDSAIHYHQYSAIIVDANPITPVDSIDGYTLSRLVNIGPHPFGSELGGMFTAPRYVFVPKLRN